MLNNTITSTDGEVGIYVGAWVDEGLALDPTANNNKLIRNRIKGFAEDIVDDGSATKARANVPPY